MTKQEIAKLKKKTKALMKNEKAAWALHAFDSFLSALDQATDDTEMEDLVDQAKEDVAHDTEELLRITEKILRMEFMEE
jgi:hypothetical protein